MTVEKQLVDAIKIELSGIARDVEIHPEKGVFKFAYTPYHSYFDIFTNISPEEVADMTHSVLISEKSENGKRSCKLKFFWNPNCDFYVYAFLWHADGFWPIPE